MNREQIIQDLLNNPDKLLAKKPFFRGSYTYSPENAEDGNDANIVEKRKVSLPNVNKVIVTQDRFLKEYDPCSHEVMFDNNLPSICVKLSDNSFEEIKWKRMPLPMQKRIVEKQTLTLCGNKREFTLEDSNPDEKKKANYALFLKKWERRNQNGMMSKAVNRQLYLGDVGLLYYRDYKGRIKSRILAYDEGYVIISHNDDNGDRLMECVYYKDGNGVEHIDCYTDKLLYKLTQNEDTTIGTNGWTTVVSVHGFSEIPLVTKRGDVAWNDVQTLIEAYEIIYNIFLVIQKRHGWGILYIRGKFSEKARKLAGSIILQDTSMDGNGSAEFKTPPTPTGTIDTLNSIFEQIQIGSSTTFLLPKDVKSNGDVSALAIMLTQSLDIEGATQKVIDWQNFADKCCRLFKEGLAQELVASGENKVAITEFEEMDIQCKFKIWRPFSENEYNVMLATMVGAHIISKQTAIEKNTISAPDEIMRVDKETAEEEKKQTQAQQIPNQLPTE